MIAFDELELTLDESVKDFKWTEDTVVSVKQYLPVEQKTELLQYIINATLDENTGCFSPLRVEVYFALAICKYYTDIEIEGLADAGKTYDLLECNGLLQAIFERIPDDELQFVRDLVNDTIADIVRYNHSAAGIIQAMTKNSEDLDSQLTKILGDVKNAEGLEMLSAIKDVVGKD